MGRYDLRPSHVLRTARLLLETKRISRPPPWYDTLSAIPPPALLSRPLQRPTSAVKPGTRRKTSRMFRPAPISYEEDRLRREFFGDHPWELARPRVVLENAGGESKTWDWSTIIQPGKKLDGESVVQRQLWLMRHSSPPLSEAQAYDIARREFYHFRHREDVERRVAREEALAVGAYFNPGPLEVGMRLEDEAYEDWKAWALRQIEKRRQEAGAAYAGSDVEMSEGEEEASLDEHEGVVPGSQAGLGLFGGASTIPADAKEVPVNLSNRIPEPVPVRP